MKPETQADSGGKKGGGTIVLAPSSDDYLREIGDQIAAMTPEQASELKVYLRTEHGIEWKGWVDG